MRNLILKKTGFVEAMVVTVAVVATLLFVVWYLASARVVPENEELQEQVAFLSSELSLLRDRMEKTRARNVVLEQETDVLRKANRLLREHESERQAELGNLQSELDFFRRLAGTSGTRSGLDIYRLELEPTESEKVYRFVLTLTQNIQRASIISGRAIIEIEGTMNDRPVTLEWSQISEAESQGPPFRFKYFQQLEGYITLPDGFSPVQVLITLDAGSKRKPAHRSYNWSEIANH
jgi:predicted RND superfamily exporter protein